MNDREPKKPFVPYYNVVAEAEQILRIAEVEMRLVQLVKKCYIKGKE